MAKIQTISQEEPNWLQIFELVKDSVMANLNCHNIGRILSFNRENQTVEVEIMIQKQYGNNFYTPSVLTEVPLIIYGGENNFITLPDPTGSICTLLFMDRNIDTFLTTNAQYPPPTTRMHDFTDCVALTTFKTLVNPIQDYDDKAITIFNQDLQEAMQSKSYIKVYPQSIELKAENTAQDMTVQATINLTDKISINNSNQNLASLIEAFLTACENITVNANSGVITPASKQAFTDLKAQFEELLQ